MLTKEEKKALRKRLCMILDLENFNTDEELQMEARRIGKMLDSDKMGISKPLPDLDFEKMSARNFLYMRSLGYQVQEIREACGISRSTFTEWLHAEGLTKNEISEKELRELVFSKSEMEFPRKQLDEYETE